MGKCNAVVNASASYLAGCSERCQRIAKSYEQGDAKRDAVREMAAREAHIALQRMRLEERLQRKRILRAALGASVLTICSKPALLPNTSSEIVKVTVNKPWRFYSLVECGQDEVCLVFKNSVTGPKVYHGRSHNGLDFKFWKNAGERASAGKAGDPTFTVAQPQLQGVDAEKQRELQSFITNDRLVAHNLAVVQIAPNEYVMAGGMGPILMGRARKGTEGIRFSRGRDWPWSPRTWTWPTVAVNETHPSGCIKRRLRRIPTGMCSQTNVCGGDVLSKPICDFDGRLSLVHFQGLFLLFARANFLEKAVAGGRHVQLSTSKDGMKTWSRWRALSIQSVPPGVVDFYFWHVQLNPVRNSTLLAMFPVSQPPRACIGISFSRNGVKFSRPVNLQQPSHLWDGGPSRVMDGGGWSGAIRTIPSPALCNEGMRSGSMCTIR